MGKIKLLPKEISELIAAGEVVEQPASVVKELVENSIDAGASQITVEIKNGGKSFIRVTDDGCGMSEEDARSAFLRHATSKVGSKEDLFKISTMGFRGEALAAISSVSEITMFTRTKNSEMGIKLEAEAGNVTDLSPAGCQAGTTIVVKNLFFNTPARLKFLKRDATESQYISAVVEKLALSNPAISFKFIKDGDEKLFTDGKGELKSVIYAIYSREFTNGLINVNNNFKGIKISGFVSKPLMCRASRDFQSFFVNRRYIKSKTIAAALESAYRNSVMVGKFPAAVLFIDLDYSSVDVNVHPAKTEIKFSADVPIFEAVMYSVKSALQDDTERAELKEKLLNKAADIPTAPPETIYQDPPQPKKVRPAPQTESRLNETANPYNYVMPKMQKNGWVISPAALSSGTEAKSSGAPAPEKAQTVISPDKQRNAADTAQSVSDKKNISIPAPAFPNAGKPDVWPEPGELQELNISPEIRLIGEAFKTYIIAECDGILYIIDKHAAHERLIFDSLKEKRAQVDTQLLLVPLNIPVSSENISVVESNRDEIRRFGFDADIFGLSNVAVREIPSMINLDDAEECFNEILELISTKSLNDPLVIDKIYQSLSCKAAVKAGNFTSEKEQLDFVKLLFSKPEIKYCPHGRPIMITMKKSQLENQFKR